MKTPSSRQINLVGFLVCAMLLAVAIYFQLKMDLAPCPLCIMQRLVVLVIGVFFLIACLHNPQALSRKIYSVLIGLFAILGIIVAGRQVYLQSLPPGHTATCGPGLNYMIQNFPLSETLKVLLLGTSECGSVVWTFLGLSIPGWTLVFFVIFLLTSMGQILRR